MDNSLDGKLLMGEDIEVGGIKIRHHTLRYIFKELGLDNYYQNLQPSVIKVSDLSLKDFISDKELLRQITIYDTACHFEDMQELFIKCLDTFTCHKWEFNPVFGEFVAFEDDKHYIFNRENADEVFNMLRLMYGLDNSRHESEKLKPINDEVAEILREFEEWEATLPKVDKGGITLDSMIESVTVKGEYNLFNIWELTPYQLIKTFNRISIADNYDKVMQGVYSGTIDGKEVKDLHWASKNVD